jgi:2,4-dienoyl-CoA reductase-like NADH-dependent reductase (Old Yellow Enzyme family)
VSAADPYPNVLLPIELGPVELRNRVVSTSHQTSLVHDHVPTEDLVAYQEARARGGVGAVFLEATAVHPTGLLTAHTIGGYLPEIVPAYRRLGDAVRRHGARLFLQLFHGGREQISSAPRAPAVAPSAVPTQRFHVEPRALSQTEIRELVDGFRACAVRAREGGVDGIELSAAHAYLAAQFFAPRSNHRDDGYNGALDARVRFCREVLEAIRDGAGPDLAIGVRLSADEASFSGLDADACAEIARALTADGLVDFVDAALGDSATYSGCIWIVPPPPTGRNAIATPVQRLRAALPPGLPLLATTRVVDLADAERIVSEGTADLVGMTRALIADPELVAKALRGAEDETILCIGCNQGCIGHYHAGLPIACTVNLATGREGTPLPEPRPAGRTLVIGGGPAGVAAALAAARAGDGVTLVERAEAVGGQLRLAGHVPAHAETWARYRRLVERDLERAGVVVRLGEEATAATADGFDRVVVATGARPFLPALPDLPCRVVDAWTAIREPASIEGPVLVADWGGEWSGLDAAEAVARLGVAVELATAGIVAGETIHQYQRNLYLARLDLLGVRLRPHLELAVLDGEAVLRHVFSGRTEPLGEIATLVLAQGRQPEDALWLALEGRPGVVRAGDVLGPRSIEEAILEGAAAVV